MPRADRVRLLEMARERNASSASLYADDPAHVMRRSDLEPDPWQAELLSSPSRQLLVLCSRQSGKSTVSAALAINQAVLSPGSLILLLSPTLRQSGELFRAKVLPMFRAADPPARAVQVSALQMELDNGSRVVSLPGEEGTIRGYSGVSLLVIDEAARVPDELYRSVRPMLAVSQGRLVCLSTPFGRRGWFAQEWHGGGDWHRFRATARDCPRIPAAFLDEELRAMGEDWYAQEYLCQFLDAGGSPLYPADWLAHSVALADAYRAQGGSRVAKALGVDPGEGVADTALCVVDGLGVIPGGLVAVKTPDTSDVVKMVIQAVHCWDLPHDKALLDTGGGGHQAADFLRKVDHVEWESRGREGDGAWGNWRVRKILFGDGRAGYKVRTIGFGESVQPPQRRGRNSYRPLDERVESKEERYGYVNRRAQMYGELRLRMNPQGPHGGFAIPREFGALLDELRPVPLLRDGEGRMKLPPKQKKDGGDDNTVTMMDLVGHSPDRADALALAVFAMIEEPSRRVATVA